MPKKLSLKELESKIVNAEYYHLYDKVTVCVLILENDYVLVSHSGTIDPENYDCAIGEELAYANAINELWILEGYASHYPMPLSSTGERSKESIGNVPKASTETHNKNDQYVGELRAVYDIIYDYYGEGAEQGIFTKKDHSELRASQMLSTIFEQTKKVDTRIVQEVEEPNPFKNRIAIQKWIMKVYGLNKRGESAKLIPKLHEDDYPNIFGKVAHDFTFEFDSSEPKVQVNRLEIQKFIDYIDSMYAFIHERP